MIPLLISLPVLLVGALLALALRGNRARALAAIGSQAVACVLVLLAVGPVLAGGPALNVVWPWPPPIEGVAFRIDALGAFFLAWSLPLTLLGTCYAVGYLKPYFQRGRNGGPHFALLNIIALSFVLIYSVQNALAFLLGWEVAAAAAWLLVIWDYTDQKIRFAGFNYLVSTHIGLFVLVAAFMLLHGRTNSMDFIAFGEFLSRPDPVRPTIWLLLGVSFALKSAFFPFHTWLPRAHAAAPAHVSALMSGVIHKAGLFGFLRFTLLMGQPEEWMGFSVLAFGCLSAFFGVLYTAGQRDLKRLLGYSSTENVGIIAIGFGVGYLGWAWNAPALMVCGFAGGLLHLFHHALFKCLLFYAAGSVYRSAATVDIERLGGLARLLPRACVLFLIGALAIAGLPPLNGFVSEFLIYRGLFLSGGPTSQDRTVLIAVAALLAFVGGMSALAMTRAFGLTFLGVARDPARRVGADAPPTMFVPMVLHAVAVVVTGIIPGLGVGLIGSVLRQFPQCDPAPVLLALAPMVWLGRGLALLLAAVAVVAWWRGRRAVRGVTWGCGYTAATPRMQYTGASFADTSSRIFASFLAVERREHVPTEPLPRHPGQLSTKQVDAVERRIFEVLGRGEEMITQGASRIPEQPRFAFAAGLLVLLLLGALVVGGFGP